MLSLKSMFYTSSMIFYMSFHPMTKIMFLIFNLIQAMLMTSFFLKSTWFSLIFLILLVSGLLVLFIYLTSIYKNYFKKIKKNNIIRLTIFSAFLITILSINTTTNFSPMNLVINVFSNLSSSVIMVLLISYMLLILLILMEMIMNMKSSFRSK